MMADKTVQELQQELISAAQEHDMKEVSRLTRLIKDLQHR